MVHIKDAFAFGGVINTGLTVSIEQDEYSAKLYHYHLIYPKGKMASATEVLTRKPTNIAIETNPEHELNVVTTNIPELKPEECLVHVRATGICGSDVHFWKEGHIGSSTITQSCGLGHESAGIVIKTGSDVKSIKVGTFGSSGILNSIANENISS